jgi:hypothetical protein
MRKGEKAAVWALNRVKSEAYPAMCKQFVRHSFDVPSKSGSARECFNEAKFKHKPKDINDTPGYVPAFFDTGKWGHSVLTLGKDKDGNRLAISVDVQDKDGDGRKEVGVVRLKDFLKWGPFQGWTEDFDGVRVYSPPATKAPEKPKPTPTKKPAPAPARKSTKVIAAEVIQGKWGNGAERKERLQKAGYPYAAVQQEVNNLLN